jgi:class 3 adenylate cyclase/tetratricopeptide (TPR) repeat protein
MSSFCPDCHFQNPAGMRFCGNCGVRLPRTAELAEQGKPADLVVLNQFGDMMDADLFDRFREAGGEAAGQRRSVTVMFADMSSFSKLAEAIDSEDLYHLVKRFIKALAEVVYYYEGIVDKILGDGLMALFGAPIAHENNSERAVRAALDMLTAVSQLNSEVNNKLGFPVNIHIGLNAGSVIVGGIGSNLLMDYTAIGDTVNFANRLQEVAPPGTVLVSESVFRSTRALFDFEPYTSDKFQKGGQTVTCYRLLGQRGSAGSVRGFESMRAPLIGRDQELEQLNQNVEDLLANNRGKMILITGEAGIGKSRLISEFKATIQKSKVKVFEGHSLTYRRSVSYWTFIDLLRNDLQVSAHMDSAEVHTRLVGKVNALMGDQAGDVLPYLEYILSLEHADVNLAKRMAYLDASQLRQQIFLAVRDLLLAEASQEPLLLILEDLHWADDASLDLITFLIESINQQPLMICAISRPIEEEPLRQMFDRAKLWLDDRFINLHLSSLPLDQSDRLLAELLVTSDIPDRMRTAILERADGIPFYLEEILRMLIDEGFLKNIDDRWTIISDLDLDYIGVPETLEGLILARFDHLPEYPRKILQAASVLGRQFSLRLLAEVLHETDLKRFGEAMDLLTQRAFILRDDETPLRHYVFRHVLTSDAVYSTLLRSNRAELHGRVGEVIERQYAGKLESQVEVLAGHFLRSIHLDQALHYLILAGDKAARDYVNQQARHHYEQALALLPNVDHTLDQVLKIRKDLGDVLIFIGEYQAAQDHYQKALEALCAEEPTDHVLERSLLLLQLGKTYERLGDYEQAIDHFSEAQSVLSACAEPSLVTQAMITDAIGWIQFLRGNLEEARVLLERALELVESTNQYDVIASVQNHLGAVAYHQGNYSQATAHVQKSLALREVIGDLAGVARLYNNLGLLALMQGNLRDAETEFLNSIEILGRIGDAEGIALTYTNLGLVQTDRGNFSTAETYLENSLVNTRKIGHRFYQNRALMYLGRLKMYQGDYQKAETLLIDSLNSLQEMGTQDNMIEVTCYLAENSLSKGDLSKAEKWVNDCWQLTNAGLTDDVNASVQKGKVLRIRGELARDRGDLDQAKSILLESDRIFHASTEKLEKARTKYELGLISSLMDDYLEARHHFEEARLVFRQIGAEFELRRTEEAIRQLRNHKA